MTRREAVIRLLETRDDGLPVGGWSAGPVAVAGFVHDVLAPVVCPVCEGLAEGRCAGCGGRGWIEVRRDRDPYAVNDVVLPFGWDAAKWDGVRERDRQIAMLGVQVRPPVSEAELLVEANRLPPRWVRVRERMYEEFDYGPLDRALEVLRGVDDVASRALHAVFVYGWLPAGRAPVGIVERGLGFLESRLPDPLRAPEPEPVVVQPVPRGQGAGREALARRDRRIRMLVLEELVPSWRVAAEFGLSRSQVNRIVAAGG